MAKARWTRESAIEYLAGNSSFTPNKPLDEYKTPYLKRTASSFQDAEQAGKAAPSTAKRRGHERYEHLQAKGHRLNQWVVNKLKRRDISQNDLRDAYKAATKSTGKHDGDEVMVILTGIVKYIPARGSVPDNGIQTVSYSTFMDELEQAIEDYPDIIDFAEYISQLEWIEVHSISFAFPNEKSK